ncbi:MAG: polyprenyl synthetase family protein [Desulfosarcinaceae bacterium]|nr:polyprenyl synthetase family protein [Desulfosarcinaceae bacterium]
MREPSEAIYNFAVGSSARGVSSLDISDAPATWRRANSYAERVGKLVRFYAKAPGNLGAAAAYQLDAGGEPITSLLCLATGEALNLAVNDVQHLAAAVALVHHAFYLHDDLQEKVEVRQDRMSVWKRFGPETAVNLGDFLISAAYSELTRLQIDKRIVARLISHLAESTRWVIAGQSARMEAFRRFDADTETYRNTAMQHRGVLMALPVVGALLMVRADDMLIENGVQAMVWQGVALQIQDDLVNTLGIPERGGAAVNLRAGGMNLPLIYFLAQTQREERIAFENFMHHGEKRDGETGHWLRRLRASGAIQRCRDAIVQADHEAAHYIRAMPPVLQKTLAYGKRVLLDAADDPDEDAPLGSESHERF